MNIARSDWPSTGPIDLAIHDLPHASSTTEWWYVNTHFETATGRELSLFAAFFRIIKGRDPESHALEYAHSATWAITDADAAVFHPESRVDAASPEIGLKRIREGRGSRDPRLNRAMTEILERGVVPTPDRVFDGAVTVGATRLELDFGGARFEKTESGVYRLRLHEARTGMGCDLSFVPRKPPIRHGDDGVVQGPGGEDMFYYFIPRCGVEGEVTVGGLRETVAAGNGWYDHEFGGPRAPEASRAGEHVAEAPAEPKTSSLDVAWNWMAIQLDDGADVTAYALVRVDDGRVLGTSAVVVDAAGQREAYEDLEIEAFDPWCSKRTFFDYPTRWRLRVPSAHLDLEIRAAFADQELRTVISKPAFWEGRCDVSGSRKGAPVTGLAYVERSGFEPVKDLDDFFSAVGKEVRKSIAAVVPLEPTYDEACDLVASKDRANYLDGVDLTQLSNALIKPMRAITDRGGKSWRSYAALACCDVVQGDSRKFVQWLAMPELLHVGSLIVDDVQDRSTVRRGGPACHLIYGEPIAINAGTAAYFITQRLLITGEVTDAQKLRLYDLYFEAMRAGHAGQALDLAGVGPTFAAAVESGDASLLERRVLATHRLKAAAPAAALARMGALVGGGTEEQIEAVGAFFEALGLAFQIVDDVLNLRGFKSDLKSRGEDIENGTVTLPVAKAMGKLPLAERRWLREILQSRPKDRAVVAAVIEKLEACNAIGACADEARQLVDTAWAKAEPLLEDSTSKVMLRAFGWYVLERHY